MSYYFNFNADSKAAAKEVLQAEFDKVVAQQPVHAADRAQAQAAASAMIDLVPDPSAEEVVYVTCSGNVGWSGTLDGPDFSLRSASINASANVGAKIAQA